MEIYHVTLNVCCACFHLDTNEGVFAKAGATLEQSRHCTALTITNLTVYLVNPM